MDSILKQTLHIRPIQQKLFWILLSQFKLKVILGYRKEFPPSFNKMCLSESSSGSCETKEEKLPRQTKEMLNLHHMICMKSKSDLK